MLTYLFSYLDRAPAGTILSKVASLEYHRYLPSANLCYTTLYYTILCYTILCYTILYSILYHTMLYYTILYYTILYCTILTILYYTILHYTTLYYTILYYIVLYILWDKRLYYACEKPLIQGKIKQFFYTTSEDCLQSPLIV